MEVTVAVPDARETQALTGLDLYAQGIQPVWLQIKNTGSARARVALRSIDKDYFSPIEVAYMNRKPFSKEGYNDLQRWFYYSGLQRNIPPGEVRSGLVFTHLKPGTKGFNLDIFSGPTPYNFTFFVPIPGFTADYMNVDFASLYDASDIRQLDTLGLKNVLENELPCCTSDPSGEHNGGPLNVAMVGSALALRRALMRGDWIESEAENDELRRARQQHFKGRQPDGIFYRLREDGNERVQLHLWLAPWEVESEPVWLAQVFYWHNTDGRFAYPEFLKDTLLLQAFARESVTADLDSAQQFLVQNLWYNQSLGKLGYTAPIYPVSMDNPRTTFGGTAYFTTGLIAVAFLSETPVALHETQLLDPQSFVARKKGGQ